MSLFNKYEPKNLNGIIGNENNKIIINGFLKQEKIPQIYLFTGAYGCGKSLFSNLIAKELKCGFNIYELNASSDRGIEIIRNLIDNCKFKSLDGNPKAYILEECHQLPSLSQDALLTTFQKPPENTYFFLSTTEKNKLLPTLISRCKQFEVEKINERNMRVFLKRICEKENKKIDRDVLKQIANTSEGHVRDALNILEIILQFTDKEKQLKMAKLKVDENEEVINLCRALLKQSWKEVREILKNLKEDPEKIRYAILGYMNSTLLNSDNEIIKRKAALIIEYFFDNFYESGKAGLTLCCYKIF